MDAVLRASGYFPFLSMHDAPYGTVQWLMAVAEREVRLDVEVEEVRLKKTDDKSSETWWGLWGEHRRHGFYEPGVSASAADHRLARARMIEEALAFAKVTGFVSSSFYF